MTGAFAARKPRFSPNKNKGMRCNVFYAAEQKSDDLQIKKKLWCRIYDLDARDWDIHLTNFYLSHNIFQLKVL